MVKEGDEKIPLVLVTPPDTNTVQRRVHRERGTSILRQSEEYAPVQIPITLKNFTQNVLFDTGNSSSRADLTFSQALEQDVQETLYSEPMDSEVEMRPSIQQFSSEYGQMYPVEDETLPGFSIMFDLNSKQHGRVTIDQLSQFGLQSDWKIRSRLYTGKDNRRESRVNLNENNNTHSGEHSESHNQQSHFSQSEFLQQRYWVDICNPTSEQLELLEKSFGFHPLTTEDILTSGTREKQEEYPNYLYVVITERHIVQNSKQLNNVNINLLLFPGIIFSIHQQPIKSLTQVVYHVLYGNLPPSASLDWILYKFLDMVVDEFVLTVEAIYREVDTLDSLVVRGDGNKEILLQRMGVSRQRLTQMRGTLQTKREILISLISEVRSKFIEPNTRIYLRDVMDHLKLMTTRLDMANEMLINTNGTYLALLSIEIAETDHRMNESMKCFGAVATIILPLTIVTGLFGMNVEVPGQVGIVDDGLLWFTGIILGFIVWIVIATIIFRIKKWL